MRPLLSLVMIVRDEVATIGTTLASVRDVVDRWTILDTGSKDGTQEKVRAALDGIPGKIYEEPFEDFAATRNRVLDMEASDPDAAVFTLMLSGDEQIREGATLREFLKLRRSYAEWPEADAFSIRIQMDESEWHYPRVLRVDGPWRYEGRVHEAPVDRTNQRCDAEVVPVVWIQHEVRDPDARAIRVLEERLPVLLESLAESPDDPRLLLFCGKACEDAATVVDDRAARTLRVQAMSYYLRRLDIPGGHPVERVFTKFRFFAAAEAAGGIYTGDELLARLDDLCAEAPGFPEAHFLRAYVTMRHRSVLKVLEAAARAADVAKAARSAPEIIFPRDLSCEWRACLMVTMAAKRASRYDPSYRQVAEEWAARGRAAGGQDWLFVAALSDPPAAADPAGGDPLVGERLSGTEAGGVG